MILHIFHEFLVVQAVGLKKGILPTVEFKGRNVMPAAQFTVESRSTLDPFSIQKELDKPVIGKDIRTHKLDELSRGEMISH
jgi:hypothetical protein